MKKSTFLLLLYFVATLPVFFLEPFGKNNPLVAQSMSLVSTGFLVISSWMMIRTYGRGARLPSMLLFALSFSALMIANLMFSYFDFVLHTWTYPSVADIFYLLYSVGVFAALLLEFKEANVSWKKINKNVYFASGVFALTAIGLFSYLVLFSAYTPTAPLAENVVTIGYTVGDLLIVIGAFFLLLMIWDYRGGKASWIWLFLFLGFLATLTADMMYAIYTDEYSAHTGPIYAITQEFYILTYLFITYAFLSLRGTLLSFQKRANKK